VTDDELVDALRAIFDAEVGVADGDDEGRDRRIVGLRVVPGDDGFDDLELTLEVDGETVVSRVLVDRAWRAESGLTDPDAYAMFVRARWRAGIVASDDADHAIGRRGPGQDELWRGLERALRVDAAGVTRVGHGAWEVVESDGDPFTVHVTPQQWRGFAAGREQAALDALDDVISSRWDDEEHIVFFRGSFHPSVRVELPPLRSRLSPQ
jgi:hypothetical protein